MELEEIMQEPWMPSREVVARIKSMGASVCFNRGELLVKQGEKCDAIFIIKTGVCRSFYQDDTYEDTNLFAKDGDIITSVTAYFQGKPALFSIEALSPMEVITINFDDLKKALTESNELSAWVRDLLFGQLNALEARYTYRSGRGDAYSRYLSLIAKWPHHNLQYIPLKHIAQYLQIAPQTLSRLRRRYVKE